MRYEMNECSIELPGNWSDRTVNVFPLHDFPVEGSHITVSRVPLSDGMTLEDLIRRGLEELANNANSKVDVTQSESGIIDGRQSQYLETTINLNGNFHQQMALYINNGGYVLCAVFSCPGVIENNSKGLIMEILNSIEFK